MAGCYDMLKRPQEAIKCYRRATSLDDREGIALHKLAKLFDELGDRDQVGIAAAAAESCMLAHESCNTCACIHPLRYSHAFHPPAPVC